MFWHFCYILGGRVNQERDLLGQGRPPVWVRNGCDTFLSKAPQHPASSRCHLPSSSSSSEQLKMAGPGARAWQLGRWQLRAAARCLAFCQVERTVTAFRSLLPSHTTVAREARRCQSQRALFLRSMSLKVASQKVLHWTVIRQLSLGSEGLGSVADEGELICRFNVEEVTERRALICWVRPAAATGTQVILHLLSLWRQQIFHVSSVFIPCPL